MNSKIVLVWFFPLFNLWLNLSNLNAVVSGSPGFSVTGVSQTCSLRVQGFTRSRKTKPKNIPNLFSETTLWPVGPELGEGVGYQVKWLADVFLAGGRTLGHFHFAVVLLARFVGCQTTGSLSSGGKHVICRLLNQWDVWPRNGWHALPADCVRYFVSQHAGVRKHHPVIDIISKLLLCGRSEDRITLKCFSSWSWLLYLDAYIFWWFLIIFFFFETVSMLFFSLYSSNNTWGLGFFSFSFRVTVPLMRYISQPFSKTKWENIVCLMIWKLTKLSMLVLTSWEWIIMNAKEIPFKYVMVSNMQTFKIHIKSKTLNFTMSE